MIRYSRRELAVRFKPNCPDHVKARGFNALSTSMGMNPRIAKVEIPLCDQEWVEVIDKHVSGWWFPLLGFRSDTAIQGFIAGCARRLVCW